LINDGFEALTEPHLHLFQFIVVIPFLRHQPPYVTVAALYEAVEHAGGASVAVAALEPRDERCDTLDK